jgi:hypothetical protein
LYIWLMLIIKVNLLHMSTNVLNVCTQNYGYLKKVKTRQPMTSDCKIEIVARFDTDYFLIEYI